MKTLLATLILFISFNSQASFLDRLGDFFSDASEAAVETVSCPAILMETRRADSLRFTTTSQVITAMSCEKSIKKCLNLKAQKEQVNPESGFVCVLAEDKYQLVDQQCDYLITNFWGGYLQRVSFISYGVGIDNARVNACQQAKKVCENKLKRLNRKNILRKTYKAKCELDY